MVICPKLSKYEKNDYAFRIQRQINEKKLSIFSHKRKEIIGKLRSNYFLASLKIAAKK